MIISRETTRCSHYLLQCNHSVVFHRAVTRRRLKKVSADPDIRYVAAAADNTGDKRV